MREWKLPRVGGSGAHPVLVIVLLMWLVALVDAIIPADLAQFGIRPRTMRGLIGIPLAPFLHAGWGHLIGNTLPLTVLMFLTLASRARAWTRMITIALLGGGLLWLVGRSANHVGASGWVFGMIAYLIAIGIRERALRSIGIAVLVGVLFGGTLLTGVIPTIGSSVSWDGHLCGALAGVAVAVLTTVRRRR